MERPPIAQVRPVSWERKIRRGLPPLGSKGLDDDQDDDPDHQDGGDFVNESIKSL